jgi:hypothetical protein
LPLWGGKQVPRCARNDRKKSKDNSKSKDNGKGKGKGKGKSNGGSGRVSSFESRVKNNGNCKTKLSEGIACFGRF